MKGSIWYLLVAIWVGGILEVIGDLIVTENGYGGTDLVWRYWLRIVINSLKLYLIRIKLIRQCSWWKWISKT